MIFTPVHTHEFADLAKQKIAEFNALHWDASKRQQLGLKLENEKGELVAALAVSYTHLTLPTTPYV